MYDYLKFLKGIVTFELVKMLNLFYFLISSLFFWFPHIFLDFPLFFCHYPSPVINWVEKMIIWVDNNLLLFLWFLFTTLVNHNHYTDLNKLITNISFSLPPDLPIRRFWPWKFLSNTCAYIATLNPIIFW